MTARLWALAGLAVWPLTRTGWRWACRLEQAIYWRHRAARGR